MTGAVWTRVGAISGFLAVAFGAFGAHFLKAMLEESKHVQTYQTGVQYHMYHALALLAVGLAAAQWPCRALNVAGWSFVFGTLLFSGSLYALSLTGVRVLGAITPFGGVLFLVGWAALAIAAASLGAKRTLM
jgi:uncharacterized membrane protein YgdD (TMEM256/DUF423 family)